VAVEGTIRLARPDDTGTIAAIYAPFVQNTHVSFETVVPTEHEFRDRIRATLDFAPWLVHESEGRVDGYAYATPFKDRPAYRWTVETSVYVRDDRRRRGVARTLLTVLLETLALQGFQNAVAVIALPNEASVALFESMGFRRVALFPAVGFKLGAWWDVGMWQRRLGEGVAPPLDPPRTLAEIGLTETWRWKGP
jgi:phosphinothricin acetyltransferase